jgi:hypothetical protein
MTKLDTLIERARTLPPQEQEALADEMLAWLDVPAPPGDIGADGSDAELARRVQAWAANPSGIASGDLHARLKQRRDLV